MADFEFTNPTPGGSEDTWGTELNAILDTIKAHPGIKAVADEAEKTAYIPLVGQVIIQVDTGKIYKCTNAVGPIWEEVGASDVLTTKGDMLGFSTTPVRVPVGNDGYVLTADATQPAGLKWAPQSGGGGGVGGALYLYNNAWGGF